ncbi:MFS transporter [Planococcus halotolerans]|uniref:MFS transporter n=1 Tax=Planococcus halotolerans TaxID=2233542 RepID=A0A365KRK1_9BACL|nr:MFS transporter [Planococcus halotolerans]QHJ69277.1 MFS transporter [Planococcus halotolerans]RAZ75745.1 MFS transporter [Planococcus halotolerans]
MQLFIYIIIFFAFFDLFAQLPIISPFAIELQATPFLTGLAVGMYSLSNTFGNIISGIFSDRKGPFTLLVAGLLLTAAFLFTYSLAAGPYSLLAIRFLHGLSAGLIVPAAFTYLANHTEHSRRGKGAAVSGAFVGLAAILGPAYGAIFASRTSVPETMSLTGSMLLVLGLLSFFLLNRTVKKRKELITEPLTFNMIILSSGLLRAFMGAFFLMFSQGVLAYMLPLKVSGLGLPPEMSGLLLSVFGIAAILVFLLPVNRLFDAVKPVYTLIAGFLLMGTSLFLLSSVSAASLLYFSMISYGIGFALLFPSINSLLIDSTTERSRGKAYGYFYAFFSIGVVAGSSFTGALALSADRGFITSGVLLLSAAAVNMSTLNK